jgi:hypothetical protein
VVRPAGQAIFLTNDDRQEKTRANHLVDAGRVEIEREAGENQAAPLFSFLA